MAWQYEPERITYFAATHTRGKRHAFGIRAKDRDKHFYTIGKSGMGKSTMLENMAIQDIQNGEGICFIDPHGSTADKLLDFVPEERIKDVIYLAPFDTEHPIAFNIMEDVGYDNRHKVVAGLMGVFERIWADSWSTRMQYILQNTLFALLEYPGSTILDVNRMLVNKAYREDVVSHITDPVVASFWKEEFANYTDRYTQEATPAIQNKIGQLGSSPLIRNILGQPHSSFDVRNAMDERKILIVNLSKGRMGEANAALLGAMLVIKIYLGALSRAEEPAALLRDLPPMYFYVDEFQNVVNNAFENILAEARKYKLALIIAHQYITQMPEEVRDAVFGNVGTTVMFRVGPIDAEFLETVFKPTFVAEDMENLGRGDIYLSLMIDGVGSQPFSAQTLPPIEEPDISFREDIIAYSRERYGRARAGVEKAIREQGEKWQGALTAKHKQDSSKGQQRPGGGKPYQGRPQEPRREVLTKSPTPPPPPPSSRPPMEVLREKGREERPKVAPVEHQARPKRSEEERSRNDLREAIAQATKEKTSAVEKEEKKRDPMPVVPSKKKEESRSPEGKTEEKSQKNVREDVPPDVLERVLKGE